MGIYKLAGLAKKRVVSLKKADSELQSKRNALSQTIDNIVLEYSTAFETQYMGQFFKISDKARDSTSEYYIVPLECGNPYLVSNDTEVTCSIRCAEIRITKNKWDGRIQTVFSFDDNTHYYAHSSALSNRITRVQFKRAYEQYKDFMDKGLLF